MIYREFAVTENLRPFIHCIWAMQEKPGIFSKADRLVPDGNIELLLNYGDPYFLYRNDSLDNPSVCSGSQLVGQRCTYQFHASPGKVDFISISFKPGGLAAFVQFPIADVTDQTVALTNLQDDLFRELEEQSFEKKTLVERVQSIEFVLKNRLQSNSAKANRVFAFAPMVNAIGAFSSIADFLDAYTINKRKLERDFDKHVGISPKFLQRLLRFKNAILLVYGSKIKNYTDLAYECGYFDQAHFNNDFKEFSGITPGQYFTGTCTWDELMKNS